MTIETIILAVSAAVAAAAFVYHVATQSKVRREEELREWQKVAIYTYLEKRENLGRNLAKYCNGIVVNLRLILLELENRNYPR